MCAKPLVFVFVAGVVFFGSSTALSAADEPVFSGPQVGERLTGFVARGVYDDTANEKFDLVTRADGKPTLAVFVHRTTRPSNALMRLVMDYAAQRSDDGLHAGVVFLSDDATETEAFLRRARHAMPKNVPLGISVDGVEGPGAYGLNRNVTLTVLVAKDNRVTANFALVQPSVQADGPKILKAIVDALGGGEVPNIAELNPQMAMRGPQGDRRFRQMLAPVISKSASAEQVKEAAEAVEEYARERPAFRRQLGTATQRIIRSGRLDNYGTPAAREYIRAWAKQYGESTDSDRPRSGDSGTSAQGGESDPNPEKQADPDE